MRKNTMTMQLMKTERKAHVNFIVGKSLQKSIKLALKILQVSNMKKYAPVVCTKKGKQ